MSHDNFTEVTTKQAPYSVQPAYSQGWATGYNTCLELTNAAELLECLKEISEVLDGKGSPNMEWIKNRINNAIKKATDEK